jgi:hypothetical protein
MLLNVRNQNVVFKRFSAYSEEVKIGAQNSPNAELLVWLFQ